MRPLFVELQYNVSPESTWGLILFLYNIGKDINGISGATISVKSMSKGIQKITTLYPLIQNQLK